MPNSVYEIINDNERAIAVFTTHAEWENSLQINGDGTGHTGDWKIRKSPNIEYVVIYHRHNGSNRIYKANISSIEGPLPRYPNVNRYKIHFNNYDFLGTTERNWPIFGSCGANPVRYINT